VAQQCEHNLASSSWTENSGIIWWFSSWISTSLKSSTRLLIWLRQMPPHSGNRSRLITACWLLLQRILYAHQHHRLYVERIFLCDAFCILADAVACSSHLKCTHVWKWIRKCCVLLDLLCENWAVCLCLTAAFEQFSFVLFENNGRFLLFGLCSNMMLGPAGKKSLCSWTNNTWHSLIRKFSTIKKRYNIKTKIITRELCKN